MITKSSNAELLSSPGIGLRGPHVKEILAVRPGIGWLEVHPENYIGDAPALQLLEQIREHYPVSLHGVSLALGSATEIDRPHLRNISNLIDRIEPFLVSEHLSWGRNGNTHLNELLPLPYTEESLRLMVEHVDHVQCTLGRRILLENPASYVRYRHSTLSEADFLAELVRHTDCGVLLDVNNLYVSAHNVGLDISRFCALPPEAIGEIHLAGHAVNQVGADLVLIDDHGSSVSEDVLSLYAATVQQFGPKPTLVEWDSALPSLDVLLGEAARVRVFRDDSPKDDHADAA
jgi:uncharacterized protein (UPF0276 family)